MNKLETIKANSVARKLVLAIDALQSLDSKEARDAALNEAIARLNGAGYTMSADVLKSLSFTL